VHTNPASDGSACDLQGHPEKIYHCLVTVQDATGDDLPPLLDQPAMMTDAPAPLAASAGAGEISSGVAGASGSNGSGGGRKDGITTRSGMQYGGGSGTSTGGAGFSFGNSGGFGSKRGGSTMSFYDDTPHQVGGDIRVVATGSSRVVAIKQHCSETPPA
jgi:hypothetical protein